MPLGATVLYIQIELIKLYMKTGKLIELYIKIYKKLKLYIKTYKLISENG